jgi:hypothetical protein
MKFSFGPRRQAKKNRPFTRLQCESLESRVLLSNVLADQVISLVPDSALTAGAIQNGNWSNPNTWRNHQVPAANANVLIPSTLTVTLDTTTNAVHTVRVDGTLQFATNLNTNLLVDTLVVNTNGKLLIGGSTAPIAAGDQAAITFTSNGPISTAWDPYQLSRGLLSLGTVTIYGATTTPYLSLAGSAAAGATTLTLATLPTNWNVGDQIVLGGTYGKWNQDESFTIQSIQGRQITISVPLAYDHTASNGIGVYITDVTRNVVFQSRDQTTIGNRGHVMFLSNLTNVNYAEFLGLDRTNKSVVINDPRFDAHGHLISGTGRNPRDRDSVDFYETGTSASLSPATVVGSTVVHSPGWGFVNHSSYVNFTNDVAFDVNGASFVSEAGDEIGSFANNLAIHSTGTGTEDFYNPARVAAQDWAHEGDGFWMQGNGVSVNNNVAIGQLGAGYYYFFKPYKLPVQRVIPSDLPINFHANLAESDDYGCFLRYEINGGTIDGLTAHNCITGYKQQYCRNITLQNSNLYGSGYSDYGIFLAVESAQGFVARNDNVSGYPVGILLSAEYTQTLTGGTWNNRHNIEIPNSIDARGRRIVITGPNFVANNRPHHYDIYWNNTFGDVFTRDINAFFAPDTVLYNGHQLYAPWQAVNYVSFSVQPPGAPALPALLIGPPHQQLLSTFGLAMGGILAPAALPGAPRSNGGTMGAVATYVKVVTLAADSYRTNQRLGFQLQYYVDGGSPQTGGTYNLLLGWNMFRFTVSSLPRTLFVLGTR